MNRQERALVERIRDSATALLDAKGRGQEHAARYLFSVSLDQLYRWAEEEQAKPTQRAER